MALQQITEGISGEQAANIIYSNDLENQTAIDGLLELFNSKVDDRVKQDIYASNISLTDNWARGVVLLPATAAERFIKGDGFQTSVNQTYSAVDAKPLFGYEGKAIKVTLAARPNFFYFIDAKRLRDNPLFDGHVWVNLELVSSIDKTINIQFFRVNTGNVETNVYSSTAIPLTANTVRKVTIANINVTDTDDLLGFEIRLFAQDGSGFTQDMYFGRLALYVQASTALEGPFEYQSVLRALYTPDKNATDIAALTAQVTALITTENNRYKDTNLALVDRWGGGFNINPSPVASRFLRDGFPYNAANVYTLIDAPEGLGYFGKAIQAHIATPNFYYFLRKERIAADPNFTGTFYANIELLTTVETVINFRAFRVTGASTETAATDNSPNITIPANTRYVYSFPVISLYGSADPATVLGVELRAFSYNNTAAVGDIVIGRIFVTTTAPTPTNKVESTEDYRTILRELKEPVPEPTPVIPSILLQGDSLTLAPAYGAAVRALLPDRTIIQKGYGGERSYQIRDHYYDQGIFDASLVLGIGRNNYGEENFSMTVIDDAKRIIDRLTHERYIVKMPPNGNYPTERKGGERYVEMKKLEEAMTRTFGNRFVNTRAMIIERWHYGNVNLVDGFTAVQPELNGSITFEVNSSAWFAVGNQMRVGFWENADLYTVTSIPDATHIVATLNTANRIAPGNSVQNLFYDGTNTGTAYGAYGYLKVIKAQDWTDYNDDITPQSIRADNIHLTTEGYQLDAKNVVRALVDLGF